MSLRWTRGNDLTGLGADQAGNDMGPKRVITDKQVVTLARLEMVAWKALSSNWGDSRRMIGQILVVDRGVSMN